MPRGFSSAVRRLAWNRSATIPGRDPGRWRLDANGRPVLKAFRGKSGLVGWHADCITPKKAGGDDKENNCQILQGLANLRKKDRVLSSEQLKFLASDIELKNYNLDLIEVSYFGNVKNEAGKLITKCISRKEALGSYKIVKNRNPPPFKIPDCPVSELRGLRLAKIARLIKGHGQIYVRTIGNTGGHAVDIETKGGNVSQAVGDVGITVTMVANNEMDDAVIALSRELSKLWTGNATDGLLEHTMIDISGVEVPLKKIAVVSVMDEHTISVIPYDAGFLKYIEHSLLSTPMGITLTSDGNKIIAALPKLKKENLKAVCESIANSSNDFKLRIRRAKQKARDTLKTSASTMPKADMKRTEKDIGDLTKFFVKLGAGMCKSKKKEIKMK